jgi:LmbE family N-acetylglucosaminyl deacetylase
MATRRVMVIMAHPDDAEFGCGGTLAKLAREGADLRYVLCTSGDKGSSDPNMSGVKLAHIREEEQRNAARVLAGGKHVEVVYLRQEDGMLEATHELEQQISREIRRWRPHVVFCQDPTQLFAGKNYINHPDHRAAGMAALNSVYPKARDPLTFPELLAEGFQPWKVWEVYVAGAKEPDTWVDVSETLELKLDALREHKSQVGDFSGARERVMQRLADAGREQGIPYAEVFRHMVLIQEQDRGEE